MKYERIMRAMCSMPWMVQPEKLEAFFELVTLRAEGGMLTPEEVADRTDHPRKGESHDCTLYEVADPDAKPFPEALANSLRSGWDTFSETEKQEILASDRRGGPSGQGPQNVAVLPIYGVISHRPSMEISSGGGFNIQRFRGRFRDALADPSVTAIVLDVDSPGGTVDGVEELSKEIYQARGKKKIVAVANTLAASAAYYIASAAGELAVTPSGEVGSIGVYMLHQDASEFYNQKGIKHTLIKAGKYKAEGNPWTGLDEEAMTNLQRQIDAHYDMFTRAVARNRNVAVESVRNGFGEGRTVMAREAVKLGMADKVATLDEVLKSLNVKSGQKGKNLSGVAEPPDIVAEGDDETQVSETDAQRRQRELDMF